MFSRMRFNQLLTIKIGFNGRFFRWTNNKLREHLKIIYAKTRKFNVGVNLL